MRSNARGPRIGSHRGDVIILQRRRPYATATYQLLRVGRRGKLPYVSYVEAVHHADRQAVMVGADVWYTNEGEVFHRVAEHRRQE